MPSPCDAFTPLRKLAPILLVEDNDDDVLIAMRALGKGGVENPVVVARDGDEALEVLRGAAVQPGMVLLDLNLPRVDGFSVLRAIKEDEELRCIPVIVLTTSKRDEDVRRAYGAHANSYLVKPLDFELFVESLRAFDAFWNRTATLPPPDEESGERPCAA